MQHKSPLKKVAPWLIPAAIGVAALAYAFWPRRIPVDVATVTQGPMRVTIDEDGKTRVKERFMVSAPLSGRLRRIELDPGDAVEANRTVLAVIDPPPANMLDARALAEATSRVSAAEAARLQAASQRDAAQETHALSAHNLERAKALFGRGTVTREEFDTVEHRERILASELRSAEFAERVAEHELNLARAMLARFDNGSSTASDHWELRSPVSGKVLRVVQESATLVDAGDALLEVGDAADLEVEVDLLSSDAVQVRPGARVSLEAWGGERPLVGSVRYVEPAAYLKISALGIEEQRVNVIIDLLEPIETRLRLGDAYRVEAKITVWESPNVLQVPVGALFRQGDAWATYSIEAGRTRLRTVKVGRSNGVMSTIEGGVIAGEQVVLHPSDKVSDGTRVAER